MTMEAMTAVEHHRMAFDDIDLHFVTAGRGPPLVLIHGFPQTWYQWRHLIRHLSDRFTIIAPDLRGLGATPGPPAGYDKRTLASDVHAIVSHVCCNVPAIVVGHDMGSFVAFAYSAPYPSSTAGLMLVDAPPPGTALFDGGTVRPWHLAFHNARDVAEMLLAGKERQYIAQFVASRIYDSSAISEADLDIYASTYSAPGAMRCAFEMYRALGQDAEDNRATIASGKLPMPVFAVGAAGRLKAEGLDDMLSSITNEGLAVMIEKCGHWISEERPDALAAIIVDLATRVSANS